jgi:pimeloyl-ACP methyl ester carboxylesterase
MSRPAEIRLETPCVGLAGLHWPAPGGPPVLCLHGWMDNAASFVPMSGLMEGLDVVALDLPGHGRSDHRHASAHYYFTDYLWDLDAALEALGWTSCHLVGHSLGAAVASVYAAAAPDRVRSVVMLDALGPITAAAEGGTARLRKSLHSVRSGPRIIRKYASLEDMMKARQANSELDDASAHLICERAARRLDTHFEWTSDPALHWVSPVLLTEEQAVEYLRHIEAPVLTMTATPFAPYVSEEKFKRRSAAIPHGRHELWPGHHHFHMDQPKPVAAAIRSFILEHESTPRKQA